MWLHILFLIVFEKNYKYLFIYSLNWLKLLINSKLKYNNYSPTLHHLYTNSSL